MEEKREGNEEERTHKSFHKSAPVITPQHYDLGMLDRTSLIVVSGRFLMALILDTRLTGCCTCGVCLA